MQTKPSYIVEAAEVWFGSFIPTDQFDMQTRVEDARTQITPASHVPDQLMEKETPFSILARKDALLHLSEEAQQLVALIMNSPNEALEFLASLPKSHERNSFRFAKNWFGWPNRVVTRVDNEVRAFLKSIG